MHAESVLFINNREPEIRELNALLKQGVGADNNLRAAVGNGGELNFAAFAFQFAGQPCNTNTEGTQPRIKVEAVLLRQNFCWCHQCGLLAIGHGLHCRQRCDNGFTGADIALY